MKNKKYLNTFLATTVAASMVTPGMVSAASEKGAKFKDIDDSYAKESIEYLGKKGIVAGIKENEFAPKLVMDRQSFAAMLGKTLGIEAKEGVSQYKDVSPWAQGIVKALSEAGLVSGYSKTTFGAKDPVTREQMAVFYVRALGYEDMANELNLPLNKTDASEVSTWAKPLVAFAERIGFIEGYPDNSFKPNAPALREDVAAMSYRMLDPENTDPELAGEHVLENKFIKKAKEVVNEEFSPINFSAEVATKENFKNYEVKGTAQKNQVMSTVISYVDEAGAITDSTFYTSSDTGEFMNKFDLSDFPDGELTVTVSYQNIKNIEAKVLEKKFIKNTSESGVIITDLASVEDITIEKGDSYALPTKLEATHLDGNKEQANVVWDTSEVDVDTPGDYYATGRVEGYVKELRVKISVQAEQLVVEEVGVYTSSTVNVELNRVLLMGEKLTFLYNGEEVHFDNVKITGEQVEITTPNRQDGEEYTFSILSKDGDELYNKTEVFELKLPSKIVTTSIGFVKKVGENASTTFKVIDADGEPVPGTPIRVQVTYLDQSDGDYKTMGEVIKSDKNGEVQYDYTSLDARTDVVSAISVDRPAKVRNEGNVTIDWSFADTGLLEVDTPQDVDLGQGTYRDYTVTFNDVNGDPIPKGEKVYVYLGENASASTKVKGDFAKVIGSNNYAEATISNFNGQATLQVTDTNKTVIKPMFYYDIDKDNETYKVEPNDPRVQAGATTFKKQIPIISLEDRVGDKIPKGQVRKIELRAVDQFGDPYLGIVKVGIEEAMDNLNETKYGEIKFDVDIDRDGNGGNVGIGEFTNQTQSVNINFGARIQAGDINRSVIDILVKDGLDLEKATLTAFIDENNNGFEQEDYKMSVPVEFEELKISDIVIEPTQNKIAEGNEIFFTVSFKDQNGQAINMGYDGSTDIVFEVLDKTGEVIADYDAPSNSISLETDIDAYKNKTALFDKGNDFGHALSYTVANGDTHDRFIVKFTSDVAGEYTLRAYLDEYVGTVSPQPDQVVQFDEVSATKEVIVEGSVLSFGEVTTSKDYSLNTQSESFNFVLRDQDRQLFSAKKDEVIEYSVTNNGAIDARLTNIDGVSYTVQAGQTINIDSRIELGQSINTLTAVPLENGNLVLSVTGQIKDVDYTISTSEIEWVSVKDDMRGITGSVDRIYSGDVIAYQRSSDDGTTPGWYVLNTSVGNVAIDYTIGVGGDEFSVDKNTDEVGVAFNEQITVGDRIVWEYDGSSTDEKHDLENN